MTGWFFLAIAAMFVFDIARLYPVDPDGGMHLVQIAESVMVILCLGFAGILFEMRRSRSDK